METEHPLRPPLADRAFLFDDPAAYLAGVDAALRALREERPDRTESSQRPATPKSTALQR